MILLIRIDPIVPTDRGQVVFILIHGSAHALCADHLR